MKIPFIKILFILASIFPTKSIASDAERVQRDSGFLEIHDSLVYEIKGKELFSFEVIEDTPYKEVDRVEWCRPTIFRLSPLGVFYDISIDRECSNLFVSSPEVNVVALRSGENKKDASDIFQIEKGDDGNISLRLLKFGGVLVSLADRKNSEETGLCDEHTEQLSIFEGVGSSQRMLELYGDDQEMRRRWQEFSLEEIARRDADRRSEVISLMRAGELRSGEDLERAAVIFQHGTEPHHFLVANRLASLAASRGQITASHIASLSLDRYLLSIGRKQISKSQYEQSEDGSLILSPQETREIFDLLDSLNPN